MTATEMQIITSYTRSEEEEALKLMTDEQRNAWNNLEPCIQNLRKWFRTLYRIERTQNEHWKNIQKMDRAYRKGKKVDDELYWATWDKMIPIQQEWIFYLKVLKTEYQMILAIRDRLYEFCGEDFGYDMSFQSFVKEWYPEDTHDYWTFYAKIEDTFKSNVSYYEKNRPKENNV
jgi:hypothetical protein